ncbi:MAG: TIGR02147 family protein [Pseudobacteriovorax sp.]|nr:TIGR02147 family protein [Pseudobacteriovorax sp.]
MEFYSHHTFRDILKAAFVEKSARNYQYSMRAFARDCRLSASFLSEILNGKSHPSLNMINKIAEALSFDKTQSEFFRYVYLFELAKSPEDKSKYKSLIFKIRDQQLYKRVNPINFRRLSVWYDFSILTLVGLKSTNQEYTWIAEVLGISQHEVSASIARLESLNLIENIDGQWVAKNQYIRAGDKGSQDGEQHFHKTMVNRALECMENKPENERYLFSVVFSGKEDKFTEFTEQIQEFANLLAVDSTDDEANDRVYGLNFQLFPMSERLH